jgi:hypothetical protein
MSIGDTWLGMALLVGALIAILLLFAPPERRR